LLPIPAYRGPDFEERLREAMDVDAMIEDCNYYFLFIYIANRELKDYAN